MRLFRDLYCERYRKWGQISLSPEDLMLKTFKVIDSSDVTIIDLSEKGVGLGIEAGYSYANKVPIITIADNEDMSTTMLGISGDYFVYENENDLF